MDEIIDVLDENGNKTNKTITKNEAHQKGIWHGAIHIIVINNDKTKTLFQKRCKDKNFFANYWDLAVGGHISEGESPLTSAKRELQEELGLNPNNYKIEKIEVIKESLFNNNIVSNEFVNTFLIYADIDINDIKLQKEEVSDVKWITKQELNELIEKKQTVPHKKTYEIIKNILT